MDDADIDVFFTEVLSEDDLDPPRDELSFRNSLAELRDFGGDADLDETFEDFLLDPPADDVVDDFLLISAVDE